MTQLCRDNLAIGPGAALAVVVALGLTGAVVGAAFPKWYAHGLLETPGVLMPLADSENVRPGDQAPKLRRQYVTLAEFRKMAAAYSTVPALLDYLSASKLADSAEGERLTRQARSDGFWNGVAVPVLPFNRRDAREFGELKDAASDSLIGIEITTDARTPRLAQDMLGVMSGYFANALVRERIRAWILKNSGEAPARQKALRAEIVDAQMRIDTMAVRIQDLKTILARYPDSNKLDARQVVSITEGSEGFLSPLAQLVAVETSISRLRETIAHKERQALQAKLIESYFLRASDLFNKTELATELVPALATLASQKFDGVDTEAEWAREVLYRIEAEVAAFSSALASFGIRNESRLNEAANRDPVRLGAFGVIAGILLLGIVAFLRAALRARNEEPEASSF